MIRSVKNMRFLLLFLLGDIFIALPAYAQEESYPLVSADVVIELQSDWGIDSDDPDEERNNTFMRTEVAPTLSITDNFFIDGTLVLEPVLDPDPGEDNFFEDEGVFVEELKLNYVNGSWSAFAGKFNPGFGSVWDFGGIWSGDFAGDYQVTEKIGFGGAYVFEDVSAATHTLTASTFFSDTTFLAESIGTGRGTVTKSDGGVSNTEDFSSYVFSLDGDDIFGYENLYYKVGFKHLESGDADIGGDDEQGFAVSLGHNALALTDRLTLAALVEYVDISNFEGGNDDNRYMSADFTVLLDDVWNLTLGYTERDIDVNAGDDFDDHLFQISGGYDFSNGFMFDVGWLNTDASGVDTDVIGAIATYGFDF